METSNPDVRLSLAVNKGKVSARQLAQKEEAIADLQQNYPIVVPFVPINLQS